MDLPQTSRSYMDAAERAFLGIPAFPPRVVKNPERWSLSQRKTRQLVIKEVNPLITGWVAARFQPRIVFLVRHPAAVAASFYRLGWLGAAHRTGQQEPADKTLYELQSTFWQEQGRFQARILNATLEALAGYADHRIIRYEDICVAPVEAFQNLYEFAGLAWSSAIEDAIHRECNDRDHNRLETYSTHRMSKIMPEAWKSEVESEDLAAIRSEFLSWHHVFYQDDAW